MPGYRVGEPAESQGDAVTIWAHEPEVVDSINREHHNHLFLPDAPLASGLRASGGWPTWFETAEVIVSARRTSSGL